MSLKAGRVGVNPEDVNPVNGKIQVSVPDNVYTKTQADNKFETKTHASNTYQPKTLAVPISMLQGSHLVPKASVESVIATMDEALTNQELTEIVKVNESACTDTAGTVSGTIGNHLVKQGNIVNLVAQLDGITCDAWDIICVIPDGYRPKYQQIFNDARATDQPYQIRTNGNIVSVKSLANKNANLCWTWLI